MPQAQVLFKLNTQAKFNSILHISYYLSKLGAVLSISTKNNICNSTFTNFILRHPKVVLFAIKYWHLTLFVVS